MSNAGVTPQTSDNIEDHPQYREAIMSYHAHPPGTVIQIARSGDDTTTVERGVIIFSLLHQVVAYFPGDEHHSVAPYDSQAIRVVQHSDIIDYREMTYCDPEWVISTWNYLDKVGSGHLMSPAITQVWRLSAQLAYGRRSTTPQHGR